VNSWAKIMSTMAYPLMTEIRDNSFSKNIL
jgi:hypothetical protein